MNNFSPFKENECGILFTKRSSGSAVIKSEVFQQCVKQTMEHHKTK